MFSRSPGLQNLNPPHPARPQVLLTFSSMAVESVSLFFFPNRLHEDVLSLPTGFPYLLPHATPHSILHTTAQIKLKFQLVFVCSHPLGSPQRVAHQDSTLARHWRLLTLALPLFSLHQAKFSAYLPCLEFHSCLDLCLFVYPV